VQNPQTGALWGRLNGMTDPSRHPGNAPGQDLGFGAKIRSSLYADRLEEQGH